MTCHQLRWSCTKYYGNQTRGSASLRNHATRNKSSSHESSAPNPRPEFHSRGIPHPSSLHRSGPVDSIETADSGFQGTGTARCPGLWPYRRKVQPFKGLEVPPDSVSHEGYVLNDILARSVHPQASPLAITPTNRDDEHLALGDQCSFFSLRFLQDKCLEPREIFHHEPVKPAMIT